MSTSNPFAGMFPGLDLMPQAGTPAGAGLPGLGSWVPTLDPKELERRISELKTVLFWLEQNAAIVKSTMQALEVQKMTLSTLSSMNVGMAEMAKAFTMPMPAPAGGKQTAGAGAPGLFPFPMPAGAAVQQAGKDKPAGKGGKESKEGKEGAAAASPAAQMMAASMTVPAQMWWNALNAQFQQLAGNVAQQQAAVEAATAKATAKVAETAAEVAEAAADMAAAAVPGGKGAATRKRASSKTEEKDK